METKDQLEAILVQLKEAKVTAAAQEAKHGTITAELKTQMDAMQKQADALDIKLAEKHAAANPEETLEQYLDKDEGLKSFMSKRAGNHVIEFNPKQTAKIFERKTTIDSAAVGVATTGVLSIERSPGIVGEARRALMVRDVLTSRPTTAAIIDFVRVNTAFAPSSPQVESSAKSEAAVTFTAASERVQTIATWIPASRQILDDMTELRSFIERMLPYYVDLQEERQLLLGSGVSPDLNGLITVATAFSTALLGSGWNRIDTIGRVIQQITTANEVQPTFIVLNPIDWWAIRLTKDSNGQYILGPPMGPVTQQQLFGLTPVVTTAVGSGQFLVGSGSPIATEIRDRMGMQVEIATQHASYFTANLVAVRAEKRLALVTYRPGSFVTGSFTSSPA